MTQNFHMYDECLETTLSLQTAILKHSHRYPPVAGDQRRILYSHVPEHIHKGTLYAPGIQMSIDEKDSLLKPHIYSVPLFTATA